MISLLNRTLLVLMVAFAGFSMADIVGKDQEVFACVQQLTGPKQNAGKDGPKETVTTAAGAVQDQDGVGRTAVRILHRLSQRVIVHPDFGQRLARLEIEIANDIIACLRSGPVLRGWRRCLGS